MVVSRAPERWERWERVPSQYEIFAATFGYSAKISSDMSVHQPKSLTHRRPEFIDKSILPKKIEVSGYFQKTKKCKSDM